MFCSLIPNGGGGVPASLFNLQILISYCILSSFSITPCFPSSVEAPPAWPAITSPSVDIVCLWVFPQNSAAPLGQPALFIHLFMFSHDFFLPSSFTLTKTTHTHTYTQTRTHVHGCTHKYTHAHMQHNWLISSLSSKHKVKSHSSKGFWYTITSMEPSSMYVFLSIIYITFKIEIWMILGCPGFPSLRVAHDERKLLLLFVGLY